MRFEDRSDIGGVQECNDLVDQVLYSNSVCLPSANIEDIMQWHRHLGHFPIRSLRCLYPLLLTLGVM